MAGDGALERRTAGSGRAQGGGRWSRTESGGRRAQGGLGAESGGRWSRAEGGGRRSRAQGGGLSADDGGRRRLWQRQCGAVRNPSAVVSHRDALRFLVVN